MDILTSLAQLLVSNAITATLLAVVVFGLTRFIRRPPVVYALWFLVLLKLVTPPLVPLEIPLLSSLPPVTLDDRKAVPAERLGPSAAMAEDGDAPLVVDLHANHPTLGVVEPTILSHTTEPNLPAASTAPAVSFPAMTWNRRSVWTWIAAVWIFGSLAWLLTACVRMFRFHRALQRAPLAPAALRDESETIARLFELPRTPEVRTHGGQLPPVLWALGRLPRVLLPEALLSRLDPAQLRTLLAHEFAHLRRRDHRTRWLELVVLTLYWWHPVAWWARSRLQEAEEQCCDAWVLWKCPERARAYAETLLATVDFLSETRTKPPLIASGFGQGKLLRRRFEIILGNQPGRRLSTRARLGLLGTALIVLPLAPLSSEEVRNTEEVVIKREDGTTKKFQVDAETAGQLQRILEKALEQGSARESQLHDEHGRHEAPDVADSVDGSDRNDSAHSRWLIQTNRDHHSQRLDESGKSRAFEDYVRELVKSILEKHHPEDSTAPWPSKSRDPRTIGPSTAPTADLWGKPRDNQSSRRLVIVTDADGSRYEITVDGETRSMRSYEVKAGDSLSTIAKRYGTTVDAIRAENDIDSGRLEVGQTLTVPIPIKRFPGPLRSQGNGYNVPGKRIISGPDGKVHFWEYAPRWPSPGKAAPRKTAPAETAPESHFRFHFEGLNLDDSKRLEETIREAIEKALKTGQQSQDSYNRAIQRVNEALEKGHPHKLEMLESIELLKNLLEKHESGQNGHQPAPGSAPNAPSQGNDPGPFFKKASGPY